jgi:hypothetical protein
MTEQACIKRAFGLVVDDILLNSRYGEIAYKDKCKIAYQESVDLTSECSDDDVSHQDHPRQLYFDFEDTQNDSR